jgi:hypothetical protein
LAVKGEPEANTLSAIGQLITAVDSPLRLAALVTMALCATFFFWRQSDLKSFENTTRAVPEADRLKAIGIRFGTRPQSGVSAQAWLKARRQLFLFLAYVSTLFGALAMATLVWYQASSIDRNLTEIRRDFAPVQQKLNEYDLAARNLNEAFSHAGPRAFDPDPETDRDITQAMDRYNRIYDDIRINQLQYLAPVLRWFNANPGLKQRAQELVTIVLDDVHMRGIRGFNTICDRARSAHERHVSGALAEPSILSQERLLEDSRTLSQQVATVADLLAALKNKIDVFHREVLKDG